MNDSWSKLSLSLSSINSPPCLPKVPIYIHRRYINIVPRAYPRGANAPLFKNQN